MSKRAPFAVGDIVTKGSSTRKLVVTVCRWVGEGSCDTGWLVSAKYEACDKCGSQPSALRGWDSSWFKKAGRK